MQIAQIHTGSTVVDEFSARFVYFYSGDVLAPYVFAFARVSPEEARCRSSRVMVFQGYSARPWSAAASASSARSP